VKGHTTVHVLCRAFEGAIFTGVAVALGLCGKGAWPAVLILVSWEGKAWCSKLGMLLAVCCRVCAIHVKRDMEYPYVAPLEQSISSCRTGLIF